MSIQEEIQNYLNSQDEPKRSDMIALHRMILKIQPSCKLWFLDGKNNDNKIVSNPNIGYGNQNLSYANGKTKEFYQIGLSANTKGISVYLLGIEDKHYLLNTFGKTLGKASITGYCIKFKNLSEINREVLQTVLRFGIKK